MSEFVGHENCPQCHSKDNLARYDDGHAWCFGCKYREFPTRKLIIPQSREIVKENSFCEPLPGDSVKQLSFKCWTWLNKYGILDSETRNFYWSESKQWLIWPITGKLDGKHGELLAWQARNLNKDRPKPKYVTKGSMQVRSYIMGLDDKPKETIIICEDLLSAMKVSRQVPSLPLFGSSASLKTLTSLSRTFKRLGVWLDMDKAEEGLKTAHKASQYGFDDVFTIWTPKDPKEYTDSEITCHLQGR